jgi:hypothetical protein
MDLHVLSPREHETTALGMSYMFLFVYTDGYAPC